MSILYRDHAGSLEDSMKTLREVLSLAWIKRHLVREYGSVGIDVSGEEITQEWYCYDDRIGWDTWIICLDGRAMGFTNGQLPVVDDDPGPIGGSWHYHDR